MQRFTRGRSIVTRPTARLTTAAETLTMMRVHAPGLASTGNEKAMLRTQSGSPVARRSFLSRLGAGLSVFGATVVAGESAGHAQIAGNSPWQPARHVQDDWLDNVPGKHRLVFDTTTAAGFGAALRYANNFFFANQSGYGLTDADTAVVIIARHNSTQFGLNEKMWGKYGTSLSREDAFQDPRTKRPPVINVFNVGDASAAPSNHGVTLDFLTRRGVHFAVCQMACRRLAGTIATDTKGDVESVFKELVANLIPNSHLVTAGILTLNRAQERGYSVAVTE
jgi:hypothetical protein